MMEFLIQYLVVSSLLFVIGVLGIALNRRNVIIILISIELILLASNINFIAFSYFFETSTGTIFALFNLMIAAAEVAIGLAILVIFFRHIQTVSVTSPPSTKG